MFVRLTVPTDPPPRRVTRPRRPPARIPGRRAKPVLPHRTRAIVAPYNPARRPEGTSLAPDRLSMPRTLWNGTAPRRIISVAVFIKKQ